MANGQVGYGFTGQRNDARPGQDRVGQHEIHHDAPSGMQCKTYDCSFVFVEFSFNILH